MVNEMSGGKQTKNERHIHHWRHPHTVRRAHRVALVVGTVLNLINHYDLIFGSALTGSVAIQIVLTYLVPYVVSTHGQVSSHLDNARRSINDEKMQ
ncbi:MAG TPA: nitrate/nitrite transporter NrtS [Novimethylophilus sp.]|jgi:hypothetical protein|uniref:nitrate/nitrite transporter NrtS n=1 Tax=Novimethylophilus sp. TaxID=2137426 RepID=UPI002F40980E